MKKQSGHVPGGTGILVIIVIAVVLTVLFWFMNLAMSWGCGLKWADSGMDYKWRPFVGCMLEVKPGKWVPEKNYREQEK